MGPMGAVAVAGSVVSGISGMFGANAKASALEERKSQIAAQSKAQQLKQYKQLNNTLSTQMLVGSSDNYDLSSTSFNAVSEDTINNFAQDRNATLLSESYQQSALNQQIDNAESQGTMSMLSGLTKAAGTAAQLYGGSSNPSSDSGGSFKGRDETEKMLKNHEMESAGLSNYGISLNYESQFNTSLM